MIAHTGFFLMPMAFDDEYAMFTSIYFQMIYSVVMMGIFISLLCLRSYSTFDITNSLYSLANLSNHNIGLALIILLNIFSLGSIPPVAGFLGKFMSLVGLLVYYEGFVIYAIILFSLISFIMYLSFVKIMFFIKDECYFLVPIPGSIAFSLCVLFLFNIILLFLFSFANELLFSIFFTFCS